MALRYQELLADTPLQLPREAARQLVGTIAHPLNRPQFDPARGIVTEGYSILQPRVGVSLTAPNRTRLLIGLHVAVYSDPPRSALLLNVGDLPRPKALQKTPRCRRIEPRIARLDAEEEPVLAGAREAIDVKHGMVR